MRKLAAGIVIGLLASCAIAASKIGHYDSLVVNGNSWTTAAGTATVTLPNSTGTVLTDTTLCSATSQACTATTTLTDAQIKALPTTAIQLVAAPGASHRIKLLGATLRLHMTTAAYTNLNATDATLVIHYGSTIGGGPWLATPIVNDGTASPALTELTTFMAASLHDLVYDLPVPFSVAIDSSTVSGGSAEWVFGIQAANAPGPTGVDNLGVYISLANGGSGNLTGGNSSQTLKVILYYVVESA
jgi:hypothetical protein